MELFYQIEIVEEIKFSFAVRVLLGARQGIIFKKDPHKRQLSLEVLKTLSNPLDQHLFNLLIKENKVSVDFSHFLISKDNGVKILKALQMTCKLLFQEQFLSVRYEKMAPLKIIQNQGILELHLDQSKISKKQVLLAPQFCVISHGQLVQYENLFPKRLLSRIEIPISEKEVLDLVEDYQDEVRFELPSQKIQEVVLSPTPLLKLKDRTGAFADLLFYYRDSIVDRNSPLDSKNRNLEEEKLWEEDLLKTGFIKKIALGSHYYCPMDKVAKSLLSLIDCGWEIKDTYNRKIVKGIAEDLDINIHQDKVHLTGKVNFSGEKLSLENVFGAFCRRQAFLELSHDRVGILDFSQFAKLETLYIEPKEKELGLQFHQGAFHLIKEAFDQKTWNLEEFHKESRSLNEESFFKGVLYPYQKKGVEWLIQLYSKGCHGLLADDMGLGKTVQVIAFLAAITFEKVLIVVPFSLVVQWEKEIAKFYPDCDVTIFHGKRRELPLEDQKSVIITTYGMLREEKALFSKQTFDCVILDEAQAIKNAESQAFQIVQSLKSRFRLNITGTPLENSISEILAHFEYLMPNLIRQDIHAFAQKDLFAIQQLKKLIEPYILRRKKQEVLKQLPEKIEQVIYVSMDDEERASYENLILEYKGANKKVNAVVFETILRLRQHCCHPKLVNSEFEGKSAKFDRLTQDVLEIVATGQKVIVFSSFVTTLQKMKRYFVEQNVPVLYLDGSTSNRAELVDLFQNSPDYPLFLMSMKAGGVGLNLTAADYVFLYDPWWNDAVENQAIDRAHRIGRERGLIARRYILEESIEEKIMKLKSNKSKLSHEILDEGRFIEELSDLLEE